MLLRSFLIAAVSSHRWLLDPSLAVLSFLSKPRQGLLSVESNPILYAIFKKTLYNHFCAGENSAEVTTTIKQIKDMGFKGVILTYAREVVVDASGKDGNTIAQQSESPSGASKASQDPDIEAWRQGVLETVQMVGEGDYLALKFTGAGKTALDCLASGEPLAPQMSDAINELCEEAAKRGASILVDAEQQFVQASIDAVALELMEKYNRSGKAVVYNTYQAYLKSTPGTLRQHLKLAKAKNFTIGVKLVRGAYINSEPRPLINDTKQDTDNSYDFISRGLLSFKYGGIEGELPKVDLFLATHNKESALKAHNLQKARSDCGLPMTKLQYGQLLGMADEVSCTLLQLGQAASGCRPAVSPEVYKCLSWGTLGDCLSYLLRRALENRDAVSRTKTEYLALRAEVWRRLLGSL
ncbi:FAD-linked oxidoreductase-like protein, partial [Thelonectria olida]